jgi:glycosyltransferase involved in cell wall biosynthesis
MARVVQASGAGTTVPPEDGAALAAAVERYADMADDAWERQGRSGRAFVEQHYTWQHIMDRWTQGLEPA